MWRLREGFFTRHAQRQILLVTLQERGPPTGEQEKEPTGQANDGRSEQEESDKATSSGHRDLPTVQGAGRARGRVLCPVLGPEGGLGIALLFSRPVPVRGSALAACA